MLVCDSGYLKNRPLKGSFMAWVHYNESSLDSEPCVPGYVTPPNGPESGKALSWREMSYRRGSLSERPLGFGSQGPLLPPD